VEETLLQLNGMYAFAALDTLEGKLYLARDPFGIKPVYYFAEGHRFAFASEVRALKALGVVHGVDSAGLAQFLSLRYVPSPHTLWQGVRRLPPGQVLCLELAAGNITLERFIRPTCDRFHWGYAEAVEAYRTRLAAAVERQLLADVPVGVLLSGGVDSALVAAMAKDAGRALPCFTVGFGAGNAECEIADAQQTANVLGLPFHAVTVTPDDLRGALPDIVRAVEEPLGTTSIMPMWYLVQRARQEVTVVLTGQGSDEPWGGYFRYQVELLRDRLPWAAPWRVLRAALAMWRGKPEAVARGLASLAETEATQRIMAACALFSPEERRLLLGNEADGGASLQVDDWLRWLDEAGQISGAERMMRVDSRMNLADDLLLYGDKISMAVSLEARVPMLDIELVAFIESLPIDYRIRWRQGKVLHKAMAERYLPSEIVHRPKKGFQVPFGAWSRGPWRTWMEERLLDGLDGLLQRRGVERLWQEHLHGKPDRSRQMFSLLMLSLWREENR
jgi:asparagine synthase (glutamine-hydrolysing)